MENIAIPPCTQPCTEQGVNKVEISIWGRYYSLCGNDN